MARSGAQNEREAIAMNDGVNNPADRCRLSISGEVSPCRYPGAQRDAGKLRRHSG